MRKFIVLLFITVFVSAGSAFAMGFNLNVGTKNNVDSAAVITDSNSIMVSTSMSNQYFLEALANLEEATGNAQGSEKLNATLNLLKANKDNLDINKQANTEIVGAINELNSIDLKSKIKSTKAPVAVANAILSIGGGVIADGIIVNRSTKLASSLATLVANPSNLMGGNAGQLKAAVTAMQFVSSALPGQITGMQTLSSKLNNYATANNIVLPSKEQMLALSQQIIK